MRATMESSFIRFEKSPRSASILLCREFEDFSRIIITRQLVHFSSTMSTLGITLGKLEA